jgi:tetratricopeptide (TPR) repeat protein
MTLSRHCARTVLPLLAASLLLCSCAQFGGSENAKPTRASGKPATSTAARPATTAPQKPAASIASAPAADPTEANFNKALQLMQVRDYAQAEPLLAGLTQRQPQLAGPWLNLGILYARTNRRPQAIQSLRQGLGLNPKSAVAQNQLGILLRESGELKAAEQAYQAALSVNPEYANAHLNLGVLYDVHLRQPSLALRHYEQYQRLAPADNARVVVWIADLKQRSKDKP